MFKCCTTALRSVETSMQGEYNAGRCLSDKLKLRCTSRRFHCVVHREPLPLLRIEVECCECPATVRHGGGSDVGAGQCPQAPDITRTAQLTTGTVNAVRSTAYRFASIIQKDIVISFGEQWSLKVGLQVNYS